MRAGNQRSRLDVWWAAFSRDGDVGLAKFAAAIATPTPATHAISRRLKAGKVVSQIVLASKAVL